MSVVGRAYVTVRAVTRQVQGDIEDGVSKALRNVEDKTSKDLGDKLGTSIGEGVESSGIDDAIDRSVGKYDADGHGRRIGKKLGKGIASAGSSEAFDEMERDARRRGGDIGFQLGSAIGESLFERGPIQKSFRRIYDGLFVDADRNGRTLGDRLVGGVIRGTATAGPIVGIGAVILPAISDALSAVNAGLASATALAGTLGPAIASAGAVGASGLTALLSAVGAVTLAFKVQSDELALFKAGLGPVRDEWLGFGRDIQKTLLPTLEGVAKSLTDSLGPTVRDGLVQTAGAVGGVARQFARLGESAEFQNNLGDTLETNARAMRNFGSAGVFAASSLFSITSAAGPLTNRFAKWTEGVLESVDAQLRAAEASGELGRWFDRAGDVTAQWGRILGDVSRALGNTFSIGMGEGRNLLSMLEGMTQKWENWTNSIDGQNRIAAWFETATPVMSAFGNVLGGLTEGLKNWAGGNEQAAETLNLIGDILPDVGTALGGLTAASRELLGALGPSIAEIGSLAPAVADAATELARNLEPALEAVVPPLIDMAEAALEIVGSFGPALPMLGSLAGVLASTLAPALEGVATILDAMPDTIMGVVGAAIALRVAFGRLTSSAKFAPFMANVQSSMTNVRTQMATTAGAAGKLRSGFGGVATMLGGPWGLAIGGATIALGVHAQASQASKDRADELAASLDAQTGSWTANTDQIILNALKQGGEILGLQQNLLSVGTDFLKLAEDFGVGGAEIIRAVEGGDDAINQLVENMKAAQDLNGANPWDAREIAQVDDFGQALRMLAGEVESGARAQELYEDAAGSAASARRTHIPTAAKMAQVEDQLARGTRNAAGGLGDQAGATERLTAATIAYNEAAAKQLQGQIGLEQAIDDAREEINKGVKTLELGTQAGRDNMNALIGVASAAGSVTGSAEKQQKAMDRARDFITKWADEAGYGSDRAERLADRLLKVEDAAKDVDKQDPKVDVSTTGIDKALEGLSAIERFRISDKEFNIRYIGTGLVPATGGPVVRAGGGWIRGAGSTTSDSIVYNGYGDRVSNLEFVVNARDAKRNADILEAINSGKDVRRPVRVSRSGPVSVVVNNPVPERAGRSVQSLLRGKVFEAGWSDS